MCACSVLCVSDSTNYCLTCLREGGDGVEKDRHLSPRHKFSCSHLLSLYFLAGKSNIGQHDMSVCSPSNGPLLPLSPRSFVCLMLPIWSKFTRGTFQSHTRLVYWFHSALLLFSSLLKLDRNQRVNQRGTSPTCIWSSVNCLVYVLSWNTAEADLMGLWTATSYFKEIAVFASSESLIRRSISI